MPLQNRVTPMGEIVATAARGTFMGNRGGALHTDQRTLRARRWVSKVWITCRLEFRGRQRVIMSPRRYTELFFLDEATALAAGHRPCAECRRQDFNRFMTLWAGNEGREGRAYVKEVDGVLHGERVGRGGAKPLHAANMADLPDGSFVQFGRQPHLVLGDRLLAWSTGGYTEALPRPVGGDAWLITPPSIVAVLRAGYAPKLHASAYGLLKS